MVFRRITFVRSLVAAAIFSGTLAGAPTATWAARRSAQSDTARRAGDDTGTRAALLAERQRVRAELERANADVDALKRSSRGLREDYRLRERLADAEALARRLTDLDAKLGLGGVGGSTGVATGTPAAEPHVSAADGPAEIDAKADILADQAQRLDARGEALLGRARDLRDRQALRRRVGQMERDPFSPLEGSKRRTMAGVSVGGSGALSPASGGGPPRTTTGQQAGNGAADKPVVGTGVLTGDQSAPSGQQTAPTTAGFGGASAPPQSNTSGAASGAHATTTPSTAPTPTSASDASALSSQLRDLLDPATLAQIRQLEAAGGPSASFDALERAGAALKARAVRLRQQAASLRAGEHAAPRGR